MSKAATRVVVKRIPVSATLNTDVGATGVGGFSVDNPKGPSLVPISTTAVNGSTKVLFGPYVEEPIETVYLNSDADAQDLADYIVSVNAYPTQIFEATVDTGTAANALTLRDVRLNSRVRVTEAYTSTEVEGFVEAIEHQITAGGQRHVCKLLVSVRGRSGGVFCSDSDAAGGADLYSLFTDNPPASEPYAVFGY
jgi:hypothetical protein